MEGTKIMKETMNSAQQLHNYYVYYDDNNYYELFKIDSNDYESINLFSEMIRSGEKINQISQSDYYNMRDQKKFDGKKNWRKN